MQGSLDIDNDKFSGQGVIINFQPYDFVIKLKTYSPNFRLSVLRLLLSLSRLPKHLLTIG